MWRTRIGKQKAGFKDGSVSGQPDSDLLSDLHPTGWQETTPSRKKPDWLAAARSQKSSQIRIRQRLNLWRHMSVIKLTSKWVLSLCVFGAVLILSLLLWLVQKPEISYQAFWLDKTKYLGLRLEKLYVPSDLKTDPAQLQALLQVTYGQAILGVNLPKLVGKLEKLPWIKSVRIERQLPDQLAIYIQERVPAAIWQQEGQHHMVDLEGERLPESDFTLYPDLPLILGQGALENLPEIISILQRQPNLQHRVKVITRQGNRRWSVTLDNEITIHLPEIEPELAWDKLNSLQKVNNILDKDVKIIDLRLPDRIILQRRIDERERQK